MAHEDRHGFGQEEPGPEGPRDPAAGSAIGARVETDPEESAPEPEPSTPQPSPRPSSGSPASFWRRLGAYLIDAVVIFVVTSLAMELVLGGQPPADIDPLAPASLETLWPYYALNGSIAWLYFAAMESSTMQATIGKHLLGVEVTDEHGEPISFLRATGRYFGKLASALPLGLGFLMIFTSERNQALHDHLASCLVLEREADRPVGQGNLEGPQGGLGP